MVVIQWTNNMEEIITYEQEKSNFPTKAQLGTKLKCPNLYLCGTKYCIFYCEGPNESQLFCQRLVCVFTLHSNSKQ
jgi:hypothetical protein